MSTSRKDRNKQQVADRVDRIMSDTRFQSLRTSRARFALAAAMIALIVVIPACWILLGSIAGIVAVLVGAVLWWMLRLSVRLVADLPDEYLDERQTLLRDRTYLEAYRWLAALVIVLAGAALLAFVVLGQDPDTWKVALNYNAVMGIFWMLEAAALSIPSAVLALRDRELPR
ncbi:hypothetical protein ACVXZ4_01880 [Lacisediminihabitans sp. FW035]